MPVAVKTPTLEAYITDNYEVESNENLKYVLSRNLLNTKSTQLLTFSM